MPHNLMSPIRQGVSQAGWVILLWGGLIHCSGDTTAPSVALNPEQVFWTLRLNENALNMAVVPPYNTFHLAATALTAAGTPLAVQGVVHYHATDSTVTVDSTGLVTAQYVTSFTQVIATETVQGVTLADTALIQVTPAPFVAPLATLSIQPQPDGLDSAKIAFGEQNRINNFSGTIPVYATVATGDPTSDTVCDVVTCGLIVHFSSSNDVIASIGYVNGVNGFVGVNSIPGKVTFYVKTWAYGVEKQDSILFTFGYTTRTRVGVSLVAGAENQAPTMVVSDPTIIVGVGARILFQSSNQGAFLLDTIDVVFDDSLGLSGGSGVTYRTNATNPTPAKSAVFTMHSPGTYHYRSHRYGGTGGTITVSTGP